MQRTHELFEGWRDDPIYGCGEGLDRLVLEAGCIDVIIGGPPCQAYSMAGRVRDEHGMHNDYRNYLFESYLRVVERYKPKTFIFENVPGMLSAAPGGMKIVERISAVFEKAGYAIIPDLRKAIVDLSEYGVPQRRSRVIILGLRRDMYGTNAGKMLDKFYKDLLPARRKAACTAVKAIGDLPHLIPATNDYRHEGRRFSHQIGRPAVPDHVPRYHNRRDIKTFRMLADDVQQGGKRFANVESIKALYIERTGRESAVHKYYVIRPNEPSNTIPAHLYKDGLRHIHWDPAQARTITVREAARLQGFPDDFAFPVSQTDAYKMIGNAVPPIFSESLSKAVNSLLK
jgi:DNA (cytosine-5)-methyltransferase 1